MKKVFAGLICLALAVALLAVLPHGAYAAAEVASGTCGENLTWVLDTNGLLTISGSGPMEDWDNNAGYATPWSSYRSSIKTVKVGSGITSIGNDAFCFCDLTTISIPSSVTRIGSNVFHDCYYLTSVTIPSGVTSIGGGAFAYCTSLKSVNIPSEVTVIGDSTFNNCSNLTAITIPSGVTGIGTRAFFYCSSLTSVAIPSGVTSIEDETFTGCESLTSVTGASGVTSIGQSAFYDCRALKSVSGLSEVTEIGAEAFGCCTSLESFAIPSGITDIEAGTFYLCSSLKVATIPDGVTGIGEKAFAGCSGLTSIAIPDRVTTLGEDAFWNCSGLTSVSVGKGVTSIGRWAFHGCTKLTGIAVAKENTAYCSDSYGVLFDKNKTTLIQAPSKIKGSYEIPSGVTTIGEYAFHDCSELTSVTIPEGVNSIVRCAFMGCSSLNSVTVPKGVTSIEESTFQGCGSLKSISIPSGVTRIDLWAFGDCGSLTDITIPEGLTSIGDWAFIRCSSLISMNAPASLISIGMWAFSDCDALEHVAYSGTKTQWNRIDIGFQNPFDYVTLCCGGYASWQGTCTDKALYCTGCEENVIQDAGTHDYTQMVTYPTLTANGYTTFTCKVCGDSYTENYTFPDVPQSLWSYNAIEFAVAKGYFTGYKSGNFGPNDKITRQDFVVVLARIAKVDLGKYSGRTSFSDVKAGDYYEKAVKWASSEGIVNGYKNGKFGVGDQITREQMVTILYNFAKKNGYDVSVPESAAAKLKNYTDAHKITGYARNAVIWALHNGVISGMTATTIAPQNSASRGQTATILMNISKKGIMII